MNRKVLIVGGTGLVGQHVVKTLSEYVPRHEAHLLSRRAYKQDGINAHGNIKTHVLPVQQWNAAITEIKADTVISCLGTTIRTAGSQEAFRAVDLNLVQSVAQASKSAGGKHFLMVSSLSANAASPLFYMRTKGEAEDAVRACGFDRVDIMQPGLLRGERSGETRYGEDFAKMLSPLTDLMMLGSMRKFRSIAGRDVARAMVTLLDEEMPGDFIHRYDDIIELAVKIRG